MWETGGSIRQHCFTSVTKDQLPGKGVEGILSTRSWVALCSEFIFKRFHDNTVIPESCNSTLSFMCQESGERWLQIAVVWFQVGRPTVQLCRLSAVVLDCPLPGVFHCLSLLSCFSYLSPCLALWWVLVCCFSDAALTSDCSLFITSVYASPFLPFPLYSSGSQPVSQIPVVWLVKHRYYTL